MHRQLPQSADLHSHKQFATTRSSLLPTIMQHLPHDFGGEGVFVVKTCHRRWRCHAELTARQDRQVPLTRPPKVCTLAARAWFGRGWVKQHKGKAAAARKPPFPRNNIRRSVCHARHLSRDAGPKRKDLPQTPCCQLALEPLCHWHPLGKRIVGLLLMRELLEDCVNRCADLTRSTRENAISKWTGGQCPSHAISQVEPLGSPSTSQGC